MDIPLDTRCSEYNTHADPAHAMSSLTLQGSGVDCGGCIAAAYVEGERLILLPIDEVLNLRGRGGEARPRGPWQPARVL